MNDSLHLYLSGAEAMLRVRGGWPWRPLVTDLAVWRCAPAAGAVHPPCTLPVARWGKTALHVVVGAALCRLGVFDLPDGARGPAEIEAIGRARLAHDLDLDAARWRLSFDHDSRHRKVIVCAVRVDVYAAVETFVSAHGLRLASLRPFTAVLANAVTPAAPAGRRTLLAVEAGALSVIGWDDGAVESARSMLHDGQPHTLLRALQRVALAGEDSAGELSLLADRRVAWEEPGDAWLDARGRRHERYADFRDLMFREQEAACA